jgi:Trk K+ transport system NAD-binding subunit
MAESEGMHLKKALGVFKNEVADHASGIVEAVVAPRSSLAGKTLREINLRGRFQVTSRWPFTARERHTVHRSAIFCFAWAMP